MQLKTEDSPACWMVSGVSSRPIYVTDRLPTLKLASATLNMPVATAKLLRVCKALTHENMARADCRPERLFKDRM